VSFAESPCKTTRTERPGEHSCRGADLCPSIWTRHHGQKNNCALPRMAFIYEVSSIRTPDWPDAHGNNSIKAFLFRVLPWQDVQASAIRLSPMPPCP
jgi:hypothetical protein